METHKFYSREEVNEMINNAVEKRSNIRPGKLTMYLVRINNHCDNDYTIVKVGRTDDIKRRIEELNDEYGSVSLVNIGYISDNHIENHFHKIMKEQHPELSFPLSINDEDKIELYVFCDTILSKFEQTINRIDNNVQKVDVFDNVEICSSYTPLNIHNIMRYHIFKPKKAPWYQLSLTKKDSHNDNNCNIY